MSENETYKTDDELTKLYNSLPKGDLVRMLIDKQRELEKQVNDLDILGVSSSLPYVALGCENLGRTTLLQAVEMAQEQERGIIIIDGNTNKTPDNKLKFLEIQKRELIETKQLKQGKSKYHK